MDFGFTEEQRHLRSTLQAYLGAHYGFARYLGDAASESGSNDGLWSDLADRLGLLGAAIGVEAGGLGGGPVETMIIMEELGEHLVLSPYVETMVVAASLLESAERRAELGDMARGAARPVLAWSEDGSRNDFAVVDTVASRAADGWRLTGRKTLVTAAPWATSFLVTARCGTAATDEGLSLFLVDALADGVEIDSYATIDGRRAADVRFSGVALAETDLLGVAGGALQPLEWARDAAIAALCAEAVGIMRKLIDDTMGYLEQRRQFGQSLASFQVLQHRLVDMYLQLELATSATYLSTINLSSGSHERSQAASAAKVAVGGAARFVGQNAVQLHGGMGMTDELAIGHYFRRLTVIEAEMGSTDFHLESFARRAREGSVS